MRTIRTIRRVAWSAGIAIAIVQGWATRHWINSDGLAYLDLATVWQQGHWAAGVNGYWSPLYAWLLALMFGTLDPSPFWECTTVKLLNFFLFIAAFLAMDWLLREILRAHESRVLAHPDEEHIPAYLLAILGYAVFLLCALTMVDVSIVTPDMLVMALALSASALLLRIRRGADGWGTYAALGLTLGLGYLAKTAMFPLAGVFLFSAAVAGTRLRRSLPRLGLAALVLLLVTAPWIAALSVSKGRFTFGDSGRIVYGVWVGNIPAGYWQGEPPGTGTPAHAARQLITDPATFEFATPLPGSFPPWFDASYWYEGIEVAFHPEVQLRVIWGYMRELATLAVTFASGLLILVLAGFLADWRRALAALWREVPLVVPAIAALGMYSLVHMQNRYIAPFIIMLMMGMAVTVRLPRGSGYALLLRTAVVFTVAVAFVNPAIEGLRHAVRIGYTGGPAHQHTHMDVAVALKEKGLEPGSSLAAVGRAADMYSARLAGLRIVAAVLDSDGFWSASPERRMEVLRIISQADYGTGDEVTHVGPMRGMIAGTVPEWADTTGWQQLPHGWLYHPPVTDLPEMASAGSSRVTPP